MKWVQQEALAASIIRQAHGASDELAPPLRQELEVTLADLEEAQEIARLGVWKWAVGTQAFSWSKQLFAITGRQREAFEPTLDATFECIHPDDRQQTMARLMDAVSDRTAYEHEFRIVRPSGEERYCWAKVRPIIEQGHVVEVRGTCMDITERRQAERRLSDSEEHYRRTVEFSPQMPWTADPAGKLLTISKRWETVTGLPVEAALRSGWLKRVHPEDYASSAVMIAQALSSGTMLDMRARLQHADGSYRWMRARALPRRGRHRQIERWYGISEDIHDQVLAEEALRESEENYRYTLELSPQIPWTADPDGNVLELGPRWYALMDMTAEESFGQGWATALHPDDIDPTREMWDCALRSGEPVDVRYRLRLKDGSYRWFRARAAARKTETGKVVRWYGILEDIDEQVQAELALKESEARLSTVFGQAMVGILHYDLSSSSRLVNQRFCDIVGRTQEELASLSYEAYTHPEDVDWNRELFEYGARTGEPFYVEKRYVRPDGSTVWCEVNVSFVRGADGCLQSCIVVAEDITEQKKAQRALQESEALNRSIVEASTDCIKLLDDEGKLVFMNGPGACSMEIEDVRQIYGLHWQDLWPEAARGAVKAAVAAARRGEVSRFSAACPTAKGTPKWWDVVVSAVSAKGDSPRHLVSISRDITERRRSEEKVEWSASHDPLTGLANRTLFNARLADALSSAEAVGGEVGLLHIDVDQFKLINDSLGHDAGDLLLKTFAERLREVVRTSDAVARLGGDEFAVVLTGLADGQYLPKVVEAILGRMREPFVYDGRVLDCRASIGASIYPVHGTTPEELLKNADIALYNAKATARGGLVVFRSEMRAELQQRTSMISVARDAIRDGRVVAHYQPKVSLSNGHVEGYEALLRWRDRQGMTHLPASIAAAFEDLEIAADISDCIIACVISDMRRWLDQGINFGHIAVNASAAEFRRDDFAERVLTRLRDAEIPAKQFQIEVTETVFLGRGADYVNRALKLLSREGVRIALDDFGTGYASLRHLKEFPVDLIKIDRSFVRDMEQDPADEAIVRAVVNLGRGLGIEVVAEGVETRAQAVHLQQLGCDYGQGFLFSAALPVDLMPARATWLEA
jgi:diguanylate cyclase (GGDEF)-like protein/PAS domain S-box-containing protein